MDYPNVPRAIGSVVSAGLATLHELDTVYGVQDVYDMLEIISVDAANKATIERHRRRQE